jgi:ABC-2 type transport system ATP-binding protein
MLRIDGLSKRYGDVVALDECSLQVPRGQMLGFLGPNGAGKTTAMRAVFGLIRPDSGSLEWDNGPVGRVERLEFGYMPEERGLYPRMTVLDQVVYFGRLHGMDRAMARDRAVALLEELGLTDRVEARVQALSHGNQQRVQLAVALVHDPELLVLDEPFSGLDPIAAETLAAVLQQRADAGAAVLFSSHQLDVVEHLCRDVVIIDQGQVVLAGNVSELRAASSRRSIEIVVRGAPPNWTQAFDPQLLVSQADGRVLLEVGSDTDPDAFFSTARASGDLIEFSFTPPPLSAVFREAVGR